METKKEKSQDKAAFDKNRLRRQILIITAGVLLALILEGGFAVYQAVHGFGKDQKNAVFNLENYQDYLVSGENNEVWTVSGPDPWMIFSSENTIGNIRITFKEPLNQETDVLFYYARNGEFDRYQRKDWYMLQGTKTAQISVPLGNWNSFRLNIAGNFILEKLEATETVLFSSLSLPQVTKEMNGLRLTVLSVILSVSGMLLAEKRAKKKREDSRENLQKSRVFYLDAIRVLAAFLVIAVHVLAPMEERFVYSEKKGLDYLFFACMFSFISCNHLFFLLSGALLLPYREENYFCFIRKRLMKVVLPLLVYGVFYVRLLCISCVSVQDWIVYYLKAMMSKEVRMAPHLWLVYELISLYILVVPLRGLLSRCSEQTEKQIAALIIFAAGLNTLSAYIKQSIGLSVFLGGWTGVFLMGYFLTREWMRKYDRIWMAGGCAALVTAVWIGTVRKDYAEIIYNESLFLLCISCGIFVAVLHMEKWIQRRNRIKRMLVFCSRYSYSVLLIHWYVLYNVVFSRGLSSSMPGAVLVLVPVFACTGLSFLYSAVIEHTGIAVLERICSGKKIC